jgi:YbbR domain-containing protein
LLNRSVEIKTEVRKDKKMHFIFGYEREVQVKIERETSKVLLLGFAILLVILFLFLTFENIDEENLTPSSSFNVASFSTKSVTETGIVDRFEIETGIQLE